MKRPFPTLLQSALGAKNLGGYVRSETKTYRFFLRFIGSTRRDHGKSAAFFSFCTRLSSNNPVSELSPPLSQLCREARFITDRLPCLGTCELSGCNFEFSRAVAQNCSCLPALQNKQYSKYINSLQHLVATPLLLVCLQLYLQL